MRLMRNFRRNKQGQFIIIAVLMTAVMLISIAALIHSAVTYYKHEPWEEYTTLIGDLELGSKRLVELSLVNYTHGTDLTVLGANLERWQEDLVRIYANGEVALSSSLTSGQRNLNGLPLTFSQGLVRDWNKDWSASSAQSDFTLNMGSIGLNGYRFTSTAFLSLRVLNHTAINATTSEAYVVVRGDNNLPVSELTKANFKINGVNPSLVSAIYDRGYALVYKLTYQDITLPVIEVWDARGIRVVAQPPI